MCYMKPYVPWETYLISAGSLQAFVDIFDTLELIPDVSLCFSICFDMILFSWKKPALLSNSLQILRRVANL